jgi:hypothetical protein
VNFSFSFIYIYSKEGIIGLKVWKKIRRDVLVIVKLLAHLSFMVENEIGINKIGMNNIRMDKIKDH